MAISAVLPQPAAFIARDFRAYEKNTLKGYVSIETPSGLIVREITLHEKEGSRWLGMPSRAYTKADGSQGYMPQVDFKDSQARSRFTREALKAIDKLLEEQDDAL